MGYMERIDEDKAFRQFVKQNLSYYSSTSERELAAEAYAASRHLSYSSLDPKIREMIEDILR
jgi:hypothetical protein